MRFQVLLFRSRHRARNDNIVKALTILLNNPGIIPKEFAKIMWPHLATHRQAGMQASSYLRRLKKKGYVLIRYKKFEHVTAQYRPVIMYFLSAQGYEIVNIFTGRERSKQTEETSHNRRAEGV